MTVPRFHLCRTVRDRAFTTIEMVAILMLLSAFAVIATRLFATTVKLTYNAANASDTIASADMAEAALRLDVSTAKRIETPDANSAKITAADDRVITWSIKDTQFIRGI